MSLLSAGAILAALLGLTSAQADSSCWPEEKLVGTMATSFVEGINTQMKQTDSGTCDVTVYVQASESSKGRIVPCKLITCANGECGDGGEHTALAVVDRSGAFAKIEMKDGSTAWLKLDGRPVSKPILQAASEGTLSPLKTQVLDAPSGRPVTFKAKDGVSLAYNVVKIVKIPSRKKGEEKMAGEVWAEVDVFPIESADPPVKLGAKIGHGFFLHRSADGKIAAVLSAVYCD